MNRSTLFTTVAVLALSTAVAVAQSADTPNTTEQQQTSPTTAPSGTTNRTSSSPSATSPSATSPSTQQNTQTQPAQRNTSSASQPSTSQGAQNQRQNQPAATQQPSTNQAAQPSSQQSGQATATTPQQRTQITAAIQQQNVSPVRVNFALNVGIAVPASVRLAPLPTTIVSIVPRYRGYSYFVTEERIVIVEPSTHKIVEVLPMEGRAAAAPARKTQFTSEQRESIKKHATSRRTATTTGSARRITVEETIPADVELEEFSDVVVREVPTVRTYRYIRRDNDVYIVDPGSRRVIDVID